MRVLILIDAQFAIHERALIDRVVIGLANEGVTAQVVLPKDRNLEDFGFDMLSEPMYYADRGLAFSRSIRASQVAQQIARRFGVAEDAQLDGLIDIVHVFGGSAWAMGRELAHLLGAGMVFEVWRAGLIESAKGLRLTSQDRALFSVPERAFEDELVHEHLGDRMLLAQWGAHIDQDSSEVFREGKDVSVVLLSSGRQKDSCIAAFDGVVDAIEHREGVMLFANAEVVDRASLWQRVKDRGIESRFTIIDRSEDRRDLLLHCDILVYPDALHEERTLLLDAMGTGMAVVAGNDEMIAPIQDAEGINIVDKPARVPWTKMINQCLDDPSSAKAQGSDSREYVKKFRRNSQHITSIIDGYQSLVTLKDEQGPSA